MCGHFLIFLKLFKAVSPAKAGAHWATRAFYPTQLSAHPQQWIPAEAHRRQPCSATGRKGILR